MGIGQCNAHRTEGTLAARPEQREQGQRDGSYGWSLTTDPSIVNAVPSEHFSSPLDTSPLG